MQHDCPHMAVLEPSQMFSKHRNEAMQMLATTNALESNSLFPFIGDKRRNQRWITSPHGNYGEGFCLSMSRMTVWAANQKVKLVCPSSLQHRQSMSQTVVSVKHFMFGSDSFIFSGSSDKNARLWTTDGKFVGNFGQEKSWDLKNPSAFTHAGEPWGDQKEAMKDRSVTRQHALADGLLLRPEELRIPGGKQIYGTSDNASKLQQDKYQLETQLPRAYPRTESASPSLVYSERTMPSHLSPPQLLDSTSNHRNHENFFRHVENELTERRARRKVREQVFGTISASKCHPFGTIYSPFKTLAITEMHKLSAPQDASTTSQVLNKETVCTKESDVRVLQPTLPRLDREQAGTPSAKEKHQAAGHTKTPCLPPLVSPTKTSLPASRQPKRCHLPSLLPE